MQKTITQFLPLIFPAANKKRVTPDFSWMAAYHPKEVDPSLVEAELAEAASETYESGGPPRDAKQFQSIPDHKAVESTLSSPDMTVHRSSIATGKSSEKIYLQ